MFGEEIGSVCGQVQGSNSQFRKKRLKCPELRHAREAFEKHLKATVLLPQLPSLLSRAFPIKHIVIERFTPEADDFRSRYDPSLKFPIEDTRCRFAQVALTWDQTASTERNYSRRDFVERAMDVFEEFRVQSAVRIFVGGLEDSQCGRIREVSNKVGTGRAFRVQSRVNVARYCETCFLNEPFQVAYDQPGCNDDPWKNRGKAHWRNWS